MKQIVILFFVVFASACHKNSMNDNGQNPIDPIDTTKIDTVPKKKDCHRDTFRTRWEEIEHDYDTASIHYKESILKIRFDRVFTTLVGPDCPPGRAGIATQCHYGNSYVYNLLDDSMTVYMSYSPNVSGFDTYHLGPLDSVVLINDPNICKKTSPGFIFKYH